MSGAAPGLPDGDWPETSTSGASEDLRPGRGLPLHPPSVLAAALARFAATWPSCLVLYWGALLIGWLTLALLNLSLAVINVGIDDRSVTPFLEFVQFTGLFLIPAWLWIGQGTAFLKLARNEPVAPEDLFRGGPPLLTIVLAGLLVLAIVALPCLAIYGLAEAIVAVWGDPMAAMVRLEFPDWAPGLSEIQSRWTVLMILLAAMFGLWYAAFFAVRVRLRPLPFLVIDRKAGVVEALGTSMRITRGRATGLAVIHLAQLTINVAGLFLCCAGLFVTLPLTRLISAITYDALAMDLPPIVVEEEDEEEAEE